MCLQSLGLGRWLFGNIRNMAKPTKTLKALRNKTLITGDRNHIPLPTGRWAKVGYRDIMVGYSRKAGVLLRLFYPHKQLSNDNGPDAEHNPLLWSNWLPHPAYKQGLIDVSNIRSKTLVSILDYFNKDNAFTPALANAKPFVGEPAGTKHPAIVLSHGLGGFRNVHSGLCVELASHGFVVAGRLFYFTLVCLLILIVILL